MTRGPSRWWYALVPFPVLVSLRYGLGWLTKQLLPTAGPTLAEALPVLFSAVGASLVGVLVIATAPLFVAGLFLDIRALRDRGSWKPHWGYGIPGVVAGLGIVVEWLAILSIPTAIGYLAVRRRRTGQPFGNAGSHMGTSSSTTVSAADSSPSWWYGVVLPPVLELTGWALLWLVRTTGALRQGSEPLTLLGPMALVLTAVGLVPVFALSLYLDAKRVGDTVPYPGVWGLLGVGSVLGLVLIHSTFMPVIAIAYVLVRRQAKTPFIRR